MKPELNRLWIDLKFHWSYSQNLHQFLQNI